MAKKKNIEELGIKFSMTSLDEPVYVKDTKHNGKIVAVCSVSFYDWSPEELEAIAAHMERGYV